MTESGRLVADEKPGVNNTIWVDKSIFFPQSKFKLCQSLDAGMVEMVGRHHTDEYLAETRTVSVISVFELAEG